MVSIYAAFIMDGLLGDPYWFPHPVRFIGKYIQWFEKRIRKYGSSSRRLKYGGVLLVVSTVLMTYGSSYGLLWLCQQIHPGLFWVVNIVLLWTCLAMKCLGKEALKVYQVLKTQDIPKARQLLSYLVGRDTEALNQNEIARAIVETVVENTSDGIIAPLMYMFIGGAPLALTYKAINTMDSMVGYKNEKYYDFGWAAAKLDDVVNFIPARLTGACIALAGAVLGLDVVSGWQVMMRDGRKHSSPNAGYPEAAAAGALGIQLGGSNYYFGKIVYKPTIGEARRGLVLEDMLVSIRLMVAASCMALLFFTIIRYML